MNTSARWGFATFLGMLAAGARLAAQRADAESGVPRFDVALGVTMNGPADVNQRPKCTQLGLPCLTPRTFPDFGLALQAVVHATRHIALAAEASIYGNMWDSVDVQKALTNHVSAILVGPRLTTGLRSLAMGRDTTRYDAFLQVLVGPEASTVLETRTALQPGAGIDAKLSPAGMSIRVAYDYRLTRGSPRNLSQGRVLCGLAFMFPGG